MPERHDLEHEPLAGRGRHIGSNRQLNQLGPTALFARQDPPRPPRPTARDDQADLAVVVERLGPQQAGRRPKARPGLGCPSAWASSKVGRHQQGQGLAVLPSRAEALNQPEAWQAPAGPVRVSNCCASDG